MDVKTWTYLIVGRSFASYLGIAIWSRARSTKEFYVAGGGVSPVANGMATAADWMSAASFISMAGLIAFSGYGGSVFLMGWTGGYVLLALMLAPYLRKYGKFTVPEFIGERFYSKTARVVAVACLIIISVTYVIGQMKGVGVAFSRFLETDYNTGLFIGMGIVFFLCRARGHEGHYLHSNRSVCGAHFCLHRTSHFYFTRTHRQPDPATWPRRQCIRWHAVVG